MSLLVIFTIADSRKPNGWQESYTVEDGSVDDIREYGNDLVARFNRKLRPGESKRKLLCAHVAVPLDEYAQLVEISR